MQLEQVSISFGKQQIIEPMDLQVNDGEIFVLMGPSGSGKTTLLRGIAGLTPLTSGKINWKNGKESIGLAFQEPRLFPHMNVIDNLAFGLRARGYSKRERYRLVEQYLSVLQLEGLETRFPHELSGGQQQRVSLGRVIILKPDLLMLDEPFSSLDTPLRLELTEWLYQLQRSEGFSILWVTHYLDEAFSVADRIGVMMEGKLQQVGQPVEVYRNPCSEEVASFFSLPNRFSKHIWKALFPNLAELVHAEQGWIAAESLELHQDTGQVTQRIPYATFEAMVQRVGPERNGHTLKLDSEYGEWLLFLDAGKERPSNNARVKVMVPYDKIIWYSK